MANIFTTGQLDARNYISHRTRTKIHARGNPRNTRSPLVYLREIPSILEERIEIAKRRVKVRLALRKLHERVGIIPARSFVRVENVRRADYLSKRSTYTAE